MIDKMLWYNKDIQFMFHENIVEYDMNAASLSLSERFGLLPTETIEHLKLLPKEKRVIQTGLIRRENKEFSVLVDKKLREVRHQFLIENNINEQSLISLHSDAVIFASKNKIKDNIDGIQFKQSMKASSYLNYKNIEMFFSDGQIIYKGIPLTMVKQHTMGLNKYLINIFNYIEDYDTDVLPYMAKFQKKYLTDQFPEHMYVPFCEPGPYKYKNLEFLAFVAKVVLQEKKYWR